MNSFKRLVIVLIALLLLIPVHAQDVQWTGAFVLGTCCEPNSLDPAAIGISQTEGYVVNAMYEGLTQYSRDGEIVPRLATGWEISDDALTYTLTLREGVQFHDGSTLDAAAVKLSLDRHKALGMGNLGFILAPVDSVNVIDDMTIEIQLSAADFQFWAGLPHIKVVSAQAVADNEVDGDLAGEFFRENAVGTGPYQLAPLGSGTSNRSRGFHRILARLGRPACRAFHCALRLGLLHAPVVDGRWRGAFDRLGRAIRCTSCCYQRRHPSEFRQSLARFLPLFEARRSLGQQNSTPSPDARLSL